MGTNLTETCIKTGALLKKKGLQGPLKKKEPELEGLRSPFFLKSPRGKKWIPDLVATCKTV